MLEYPIQKRSAFLKCNVQEFATLNNYNSFILDDAWVVTPGGFRPFLPQNLVNKVRFFSMGHLIFKLEGLTAETADNYTLTFKATIKVSHRRAVDVEGYPAYTVAKMVESSIQHFTKGLMRKCIVQNPLEFENDVFDSVLSKLAPCNMKLHACFIKVQ